MSDAAKIADSVGPPMLAREAARRRKDTANRVAGKRRDFIERGAQPLAWKDQLKRGSSSVAESTTRPCIESKKSTAPSLETHLGQRRRGKPASEPLLSDTEVHSNRQRSAGCREELSLFLTSIRCKSRIRRSDTQQIAKCAEPSETSPFSAKRNSNDWRRQTRGKQSERCAS